MGTLDLARKRAKFQVFISHSATDTWIAQRIAAGVERCGAASFLDKADVETGDDFEDRIIKAAEVSDELLVLLTPWATTRPYIWMEIGAFWCRRKRIVGVLLGLQPDAISADLNIPVALKKSHLLTLNQIELYFSELSERVKRRGG